MKKYLELFNNGFDNTITEKLKPENWPYIGYDALNDTVAWSTIVEKEEPLVPGFVDLGLSVLWAECNVGANNAHDLGTGFTWGSNAGKDLVQDKALAEIINPRLPSYSAVAELYNNTTRIEETVNGVSGYRFVGSTGNSIFIPYTMMWLSDVTIEGGTWNTLQASTWNGTTTYDNNELKSTLLPHRCICDYPPKGTLLSKNTITDIDPTKMYVAVSKDIVEVTDPVNPAIEDYIRGSVFTFYSDQPIIMNLYNTYDKVDDSGQSTLVVSRTSHRKEQNIQEIQLSAKELIEFADSAYCYIEFVAAQSCQCVYDTWAPSACVNRSTIIKSANRFSIAAKSSSNIYRLRYSDWKGYDITIKWAGGGSLPTYISDTCEYFLSTTNEHVVKYVSVPKRGSTVLTADVVNSWESRVDADGFLYVRMNPTVRANVTFTSSKPAEEDPTNSEAYSITPVTASTTSSIDCGCETE